MAVSRSSVASFAFLGDRLEDLDGILARAFAHPWVASYQVGFGPPLVKANETLTERLRDARSALDKLRVYLEVCVYDSDLRERLATSQRRLLTRRLGPLEAEAVRRASADVLDLSLRLHHPDRAPPEVRDDMKASGVIASEVPKDLAPDLESGRFWVHLSDPRNSRLLHDESVERAVEDPERALALEMWVPIGLRGFFRIWGQALARDCDLVTLDLGAPRAAARVSRDGQRT